MANELAHWGKCGMVKEMEQIIEGPPWDEGVQMLQFAPLTESVVVDVAVIGGGITGITAAYLLAQAGRTVALLERDRLVHGATGLTTAFLTQYIDTDLAELISLFGVEKARAVVRSHGAAIDQVEQVVKEENIACEFTRCSHFVYAVTPAETQSLQEERRAAAQLGLNMVFHDDAHLPWARGGYVVLDHQAKFHPRQYLAALVQRLSQQGGQIFEQTEVVKLSTDTGATVRLETRAGEVRANHVVVATHMPFDKKLYFKKGLYTTYVYEVQIPYGKLAEGIYEDTRTPYTYFRVDPQETHDRLILGGADHRAQIPISPEKNFRALDEQLAAILPDVSSLIVRRWRGPIVEPVDGLAFIGPLHNKQIVYATGFSGNGMTYGTMAAQIATDVILDRVNEWAQVYAATRVPGVRELTAKGRDYIQEFIGGAVKNTLR